MRVRSSNILTLALILVAFASCLKRPDGVRSDREMLPVVTDMSLADSYLRSVSGNSPEEREAMISYILDKYGMSRADYDSTMIWYARNADAYYEFSEKVDKELGKRQKKLTGASAQIEQSNDLWPYARMAVISPLGVFDGFNFSIPTVDVERGDRIRLKMRMNSAVDGDVLLGVEYENGSIGYQTTSLRGNKFEFALQTDTAKKVKRIFGNMTMDREVKKTIWLDSISMSVLPLDSTLYYQIHSQRRYSKPQRRVPASDAARTDTIDTVSSTPKTLNPVDEKDKRHHGVVKPTLRKVN